MSKHWVNSLIPLYNESGGHVGVWRAIQMVIFISMNLLQILMIYVIIIVIFNIAVFKVKCAWIWISKYNIINESH